MNLDNALSRISEQVKQLIDDGHDVYVTGVQIDPATDYPGQKVDELMAVVETRGGALMAASFHDSESWTAQRREELELTFAAAATMKAAFCEVDRAS